MLSVRSSNRCFVLGLAGPVHRPPKQNLPAQRHVQQASSSTAKESLGAGTLSGVLGSALVLAWRRISSARRSRGIRSRGLSMAAVPDGYSVADQVARTAALKKAGNKRYLDIDSVYEPSTFKGKRVLVVGGNRGLGLKIVEALVDAGADAITTTRKASPNLEGMEKAGKLQVITGVDMQDTASIGKMAAAIKEPLDYVIHSAGYFMEEKETLKKMDFEEELKQIDICAVAPLRVVSELYKADKLKQAKVAIISSQAGSAEWRFTQNKDEGGDYGHHMSRAACNIGGVLMSEELKAEKIPVVMLHPGFNRTEMTAKYSEIWDIEGAVEPEVGAKRVLHEVSMISMESTGKFINCEDGLLIPW